MTAKVTPPVIRMFSEPPISNVSVVSGAAPVT